MQYSSLASTSLHLQIRSDFLQNAAGAGMQVHLGEGSVGLLQPPWNTNVQLLPISKTKSPNDFILYYYWCQPSSHLPAILIHVWLMDVILGTLSTRSLKVQVAGFSARSLPAPIHLCSAATALCTCLPSIWAATLLSPALGVAICCRPMWSLQCGHSPSAAGHLPGFIFHMWSLSIFSLIHNLQLEWI